MQWRRAWGILAVVVLIAPVVVVAQEGHRGNRGDIQVTNDALIGIRGLMKRVAQ